MDEESVRAADGVRTIERYVFGSRDETARAFDHANRECLDEAVATLGKVLTIQLMLPIKGAHLFDDRFDAYALLRSALDTLVSALHLARHRARVEVACLARSAIEAGCTALHIRGSPEAYSAFIDGSYKSTGSIDAAKKKIPVVGKLWGGLSTAGVHINRRGHGPKGRLDREQSVWVESVDVNFGERPEDLIVDQMSLTLITLVADIVDQAQHLALFDEDPSRPGWRVVPGTGVVTFSGSAAGIERRFEEFLRLADKARLAS